MFRDWFPAGARSTEGSPWDKMAADMSAGSGPISTSASSQDTCCDSHHDGQKGMHRMPTIFDIVKSG